MINKFFNLHHVCFERWGLSKYRENLAEIKQLRKNYRNYPYLYCYDEQEETQYHESYMKSGETLDAFVAIYNGTLIGISIGCPLQLNIPICSDLISLPLNIGKPYYFGDIIISDQYWGNGIAQQLYNKHLEFISNQGFSKVLALLVEREDNDPREPAHYCKSTLWSKNEFKPTEHTTSYTWNTFCLYGNTRKETHSMRVHQKLINN